MKSEKITNSSSARTYNDACAAAHALDLLGERWTLLVVRELIPGPKRFTDLRAGLPGISANVLTQRLATLEEAAVVERQELAPPAAGRVYALTEWGREAEPIFQALGRWGARSPAHDPTAPVSTASVVMSLRTMFSPERTHGRSANVALTFGRERFLAQVTPKALLVERSDAPAELELVGDARAIASVIYAGIPPEALEGEGALTVAGERGLIAWFASLFPLPHKAQSRAELVAAPRSGDRP